MNDYLWSELDKVSDQIKSQYDEDHPVFSIHTPVRFKRSCKGVTAGTKAVIVDRQNNYYAVAVKGKYLESIHCSFLTSLE